MKRNVCVYRDLNFRCLMVLENQLSDLCKLAITRVKVRHGLDPFDDIIGDDLCQCHIFPINAVHPKEHAILTGHRRGFKEDI